MNFKTSQAQTEASLYEGESIVLRASAVWSNFRYGIQFFCRTGVFTYLFSQLELCEDRGCGWLMEMLNKCPSRESIEKKQMGKCHKRSTSVAGGLSFPDFIGELKTHDRWTLMEQILSFMIDNLKKNHCPPWKLILNLHLITNFLMCPYSK